MITINLLPPIIKEHIEYAKRNVLSLRIGIFWLALSGILVGAFVTTTVLITIRSKALEGQISQIKSRIESVKKVDGKDAEVESQRIARKLGAIERITKGQTKWSTIVEELALLAPPRLVIASIAFTGNAKEKITFSGTADSLTTIALFRNAIEASPHFANADIIHAAAAGSGYTYTMSMSIQTGTGTK